MKAIREVLEKYAAHVRPGSYGSALLESAREEAEAIEKAAVDLTRLNLGDYTYNVRDSAHVLATTPDGGNTWEHPDVKAWSDAAQVMQSIAKESK